MQAKLASVDGIPEEETTETAIEATAADHGTANSKTNIPEKGNL
jgi:hypothetical protein